MQNRMNSFAILFVAICLSGLPGLVSDAHSAIFSDDFEAYAPNSDLDGQGFWTSGSNQNNGQASTGWFLNDAVWPGFPGRVAWFTPTTSTGPAMVTPIEDNWAIFHVTPGSVGTLLLEFDYLKQANASLDVALAGTNLAPDSPSWIDVTTELGIVTSGDSIFFAQAGLSNQIASAGITTDVFVRFRIGASGSGVAWQAMIDNVSLVVEAHCSMFADDFESYAPNSDLDGQGFWTSGSNQNNGQGSAGWFLNDAVWPGFPGRVAWFTPTTSTGPAIVTPIEDNWAIFHVTPGSVGTLLLEFDYLKQANASLDVALAGTNLAPDSPSWIDVTTELGIVTSGDSIFFAQAGLSNQIASAGITTDVFVRFRIGASGSGVAWQAMVDDVNLSVAGCGDGCLTGTEQCDDGNTSNGDCCSAGCQFETNCWNQDNCENTYGGVWREDGLGQDGYACFFPDTAHETYPNYWQGDSCTDSCVKTHEDLRCVGSNWNDDTSCTLCQDFFHPSASTCSATNEPDAPKWTYSNSGGGDCYYRAGAAQDCDLRPTGGTAQRRRVCACEVAVPLCGDGFVDPGEQCDDGNTQAGDNCDETCRVENPFCGDSLGADDETCDLGDLNGVAGSGCDESCQQTLCYEVDCGDSGACWLDLCDDSTGTCFAAVREPEPAGRCLEAGLNSFQINDKTNPKSDKIKWKWARGEATPFADYGAPATTTAYDLCVYDETGDMPALKAEMHIPASGSWQAKGGKLWKYKDKAAAADGLLTAKMKSGEKGRASIALKAKGANTPMPGPIGGIYFAQDSNVVVQLENDEGVCWVSRFPTAVKNTETIFKTKLKVLVPK